MVNVFDALKKTLRGDYRLTNCYWFIILKNGYDRSG